MQQLAPDPLLRNVPPNSVDAERAVLGAILVDGRAVDAVAQILSTAEDFYSTAHAHIYETLLELWNRDQPVDVVLLNEELDKKGVLDQVGGTAFLAELCDVVPTAANAEYYAKIVRDRAVQRKLIEVAAGVQKDAFETSGGVDQLLDRAEQVMFEVTQRRIRNEATVIGHVVKEAYEQLVQREQGKGVVGLPSYYADLDELTSGFLPGEMTIVAARPSMGKTSFALNIVRNIVHHGGCAAFFSLEMPKIQVTTNMLCAIAKLDGHRLRGGFLTREEKRNFMNACDILEPAQLFIDDSPTLSTMELRAKGRRLKAQHNIEMILIDYMQLMTGSSRSAKESRQIEVSEISRQVKALARELEIPIVCLAQLSRKVEDRKDKRPMMSDLRESGCLAGDSSVPLSNGERVPIRELAGETGFDVWALDDASFRLEKVPVSRAFSTGVKPLLRLRTRLGRSIRATGNHKFLTPYGWRRLDSLGVDDFVAIPRGSGIRAVQTPRLRACLDRRSARKIRWDPIIAIEPEGQEEVFDLTVPGPHNFVADGIVVHNSIEQDADKIVLLHRPEYYEPDKEELRNKANIIVAKNRNGPTGDVEMVFIKNQMRFESATRM